MGLTLYGVFPILRNTVTGIQGVDPALKEAARGVGMTTRQQLMRVELPLAMPVIVAGIRTSTVWVVGIATLSTPVGATSLGNYIFSGLQTRNYIAVLVGCVAAAGLALLLDGLVRSIEAGVRTRRRTRVVAALGVTAGLVVYTAVTLAAPLLTTRSCAIVIGSKTFTEQYILSALLAEWIDEATGRTTTLMQSLGSIVAFDALAAGDIDVYVDYSGTLWANEMGRGHVTASRGDVLTGVEQFLRREHGITLAATLGFENAYALAMRAEDAERLDLRRISDLRPYALRWRSGATMSSSPGRNGQRSATRTGSNSRRSERWTRRSCIKPLPRAMSTSSARFPRTGGSQRMGLAVLEDDRHAIPPYDALVLVSARLAQEAPEVLRALTRLDRLISVDQMRAMNLAVDEAGENPAVVARRFIGSLRAE